MNSFRCVLMIEVGDESEIGSAFVGRPLDLPFLPQRGMFVAGHGLPESGVLDVVLSSVWVVSTGVHFVYLGSFDDAGDGDDPRPRTPEEVARLYGDNWRTMIPMGVEQSPQWIRRTV